MIPASLNNQLQTSTQPAAYLQLRKLLQYSDQCRDSSVGVVTG
jgi:hypothetical protein